MPSREDPQLFDLPLDPDPPRKRRREASSASKSEKGKQSPEQVEREEDMEHSCAWYAIVRDVGELESVLKRWEAHDMQLWEILS